MLRSSCIHLDSKQAQASRSSQQLLYLNIMTACMFVCAQMYFINKVWLCCIYLIYSLPLLSKKLLFRHLSNTNRDSMSMARVLEILFCWYDCWMDAFLFTVSALDTPTCVALLGVQSCDRDKLSASHSKSLTMLQEKSSALEEQFNEDAAVFKRFSTPQFNAIINPNSNQLYTTIHYYFLF